MVTRPRILRLLRIAFSILCGIVCLLLIVLWVRSLLRLDQIIRRVSTAEYNAITSAQGRLFLARSDDPNLRIAFRAEWTRRKKSLTNLEEGRNYGCFPASVPELGLSSVLPWLEFQENFYIQSGNQIGTSYEIIVPYWMLFLLFAMLATVPWANLLFAALFAAASDGDK